MANKFNEKLPVIEIILVLIFAVSLVLKLLNLGFGGTFIILSMSSLAMIYFLIGYQPAKPDTPPLNRFIYKLTYLASSVTVLAILFRIQHYHGYEQMIFIGCAPLAISLFLGFFLKPGMERRMIIRTFVILIIALVLYYSPIS